MPPAVPASCVRRCRFDPRRVRGDRGRRELPSSGSPYAMQLLQEHIATSALQRQPLAAYLKLFYLNLRGNARERAAAYRTSHPPATP